MHDHKHALTKLLADGGLLFDRADIRPNSSEENYFLEAGQDRSRKFKPDFRFLIEVCSPIEIQSLVEYSRKHGLALVPSGGRTGLVGGAVASQGEIVLSLKRLNTIIKIHPEMPSIQAQAGVITAHAIAHADEAGYLLPLDLAASGSSQIGGNVATHAGGIRVIRYGLLREHVLGLQVITGTGEILNFNGNIYKNNTGYDLRQLFIGSEGTLGIITEVSIRLMNKPADPCVAILATQDLPAAYTLLSDLRHAGLRPLAFEYFDRNALQVVCKHLSLGRPLSRDYAHYCLMEWDRSEIDEPRLMQILEPGLHCGTLLDASLAGSTATQKKFWQYREGISESLSMDYFVYKNDIALSVKLMPHLITKLQQVIADQYPDILLAVFGHLGDGNLHLNLFQNRQNIKESDFQAQITQLEKIIYHSVEEGQGSISAEHGIGLLKKEHLRRSRSTAEIQFMRGIKSVFDPDNVLNPGKIF